MKKLFLTILFLLVSVFCYAREVTLTWDANAEPDMDHYVVHWGTTSGAYDLDVSTEGLETTHTVHIPDEGVYYFVVTAVDIVGLESDYSNEVSTEGLTPPDDYLYLPPVDPVNNQITSQLQIITLPDGTILAITPIKTIVTYSNGLITEIVGTTVTVITRPGED